MRVTNNYQFSNTNYYIKKAANPPNFKGYMTNEIINYMGDTVLLVHETAFFRENKTLRYAVNYINNVFKDVKEKYFIVGACSTGEEVWSLKMLMKDNPVKILGFDLGEEAIKKAKKGEYALCKICDEQTERNVAIWGYNAFKDSYLAFEKDGLGSKKREEIELFKKMFEYIPENKYNIFKKFITSLKYSLWFPKVKIKEKKFKVKNNDNCDFMVADIANLKGRLPDEKCQLFMFRNALYHLMTDYAEDKRVSYSEKINTKKLENIFKQINGYIEKDGLFILGEKEYTQETDMRTVEKVLRNTGFEPEAKINNKRYFNIWRKA